MSYTTILQHWSRSETTRARDFTYEIAENPRDRLTTERSTSDIVVASERDNAQARPSPHYRI
ncbi:hypothetical protein WH47_03454 [Habropoda laboriosa]|uniref:Uncharacterized protein n=1 Tax=Habropoda laboriosa TaxID=597456 RepID=A0A0L7RC07_9HYME|nr:hypothetical protein WH47_03454 [Habropoda laboriosa]